MKKFSAFLSESERSFAAKSAEKLKLKHIGYGRYADPRGNVTHMSKDGKTVKLHKMTKDPSNPMEEKKLQMARVRSIKAQYLLHLEDLIHLLLGTKALAKVAQEAKSSGGEYRIYPSRSEDPKKNPLDAGTKIKFMRQWHIQITRMRLLIMMTCVLFLTFLPP